MISMEHQSLVHARAWKDKHTIAANEGGAKAIKCEGV